MQGLKCAKPLMLAFVAAVGVAGVQAQNKYLINDLGILSGGLVSIPSKINANGWVVGTSRRVQSESAFLHNTTTLIDIGTLPGFNRANAVDINRFNRIVGTAGQGGGARAFVWNNNSIQELAPNIFTGPDGRHPSEAGAINDAGVIVGNDMADEVAFAFSGSQALPSPGTIYVTAINNRNRAVGHYFDGFEQRIWNWIIPIAPNTTEQFQEVNAFRPDDTHGSANDVTDFNVFDPADEDHLLVGTVSHRVSSTFNDQGLDMGAYASPVDGGVFYLPALPGDNVTDAYSVNRGGVIVGRSGRLQNVTGQTTTSWRACMWVPAPAPVFYVALEGQTLLPFNTDIVADNFTSINDQRQVAGTYTRNGTIRSFRLDPVLSPILVELDTTSIAGGLSTQGTVFIDGLAPTGGVVVNLKTNNGIVQLPATVTIPSNQQDRGFNINTSPVSVSTPVLITAERFGYTASNTLRVQPPTLLSITPIPARITGGFSAKARLVILGLAPANGFNITLSTSNPNLATMSAGIKIPAGASSIEATVVTKAVQNSQNVTLSASANNITRTAVLNVSTPFLESITLNSSSVLGGTLVIGTAKLTANSLSGGSKVLLKSSAPSVASVPAQVVVPAGQRSATFPVNTVASVTTSNVTITGNFNASTKTFQLQVRGAELRHLILNPTTVLGGEQTSKGSVALDAVAPAGGATVSLSSSDAGAAPPSNVTIPAGSTYRQFTIATNIVDSSRIVTILASYLTVTKTAPLTVQGADLIVHDVPGTVQPPVGGAYPLTVTCSVLLNRAAQAGGARIFLFTSEPAAALPPFGVLIPPGQSFATYPLQVLRAEPAPGTTITATRGAISIERQIVAL